MKPLSPRTPPTPVGADVPSGKGYRPSSARLLLPSPEVVRTHAPILVPTALASALIVATVLTTMPLVRAAFAQRPELLPLTTGGLWVMAGLSPVTVLLKGVILGGVAWCVLVLLGASARYRTLVSAVTYGQVILSLEGAWVALLLWLRGAAALHRPADLVLSVGLDAFVRDPTSALAAVARMVTPFQLAWFVFLTLVLTDPEGRERWKGAVAAVVVWSLATGFGVARALVA